MKTSRAVFCIAIFFCGISLRSLASGKILMATYLLQSKHEGLKEKSYLHDYALDLKILVYDCQSPKTLAETEKRQSYINIARLWQKIPTKDRNSVLALVQDADEQQVIFNAMQFCQKMKLSGL